MLAFVPWPTRAHKNVSAFVPAPVGHVLAFMPWPAREHEMFLHVYPCLSVDRTFISICVLAEELVDYIQLYRIMKLEYIIWHDLHRQR